MARSDPERLYEFYFIIYIQHTNNPPSSQPSTAFFKESRRFSFEATSLFIYIIDFLNRL